MRRAEYHNVLISFGNTWHKHNLFSWSKAYTDDSTGRFFVSQCFWGLTVMCAHCTKKRQVLLRFNKMSVTTPRSVQRPHNEKRQDEEFTKACVLLLPSSSRVRKTLIRSGDAFNHHRYKLEQVAECQIQLGLIISFHSPGDNSHMWGLTGKKSFLLMKGF